jgi:hypothetical protein
MKWAVCAESPQQGALGAVAPDCPVCIGSLDNNLIQQLTATDINGRLAWPVRPMTEQPAFCPTARIVGEVINTPHQLTI